MESGFRYLLTISIGVVAITQFVQVFSRYVIQTPVMGLEEATVFPSLWLYMMGAANASRENSQIRANVLEIFIKNERGLARLGILTEIVSLIVCGWLIRWAWDFTDYSLRTWRESATLYWPTFYADVALILGLSVVFAFTLRTLWNHVLVLKGTRVLHHG